VPWGQVALGGSSLRHLRKGSTQWEVLFRLPEKELYRVDGHETGLLLASWENDDDIHLFDIKTKAHRTLSKPQSPKQTYKYTTWSLDDLYFSKDGRSAIVFMHGLVDSCTWGTAGFFYPLDGKSRPKLLYEQPGHNLHHSSDEGLYAWSTNWSRPCDMNGCPPLSGLTLYEIHGDKAVKRDLLKTDGDEYSAAHMVWGVHNGQGAVEIHGRKFARQFLRWKRGVGRVSMKVLPEGPSWEAALDRMLPNGDILEFWELWKDKDRWLELWVFKPDGSLKKLRFNGLRPTVSGSSPNNSLYGFRQRKDGSFVMQWGNHLVLLSKDYQARAMPIDPLMKRGNEWAGAMLYQEEPEGVWIGIEIGGGRDLVYVSLAEAEKKAKPLP
jgi:hypothetical protein